MRIGTLPLLATHKIPRSSKINITSHNWICWPQLMYQVRGNFLVLDLPFTKFWFTLSWYNILHFSFRLPYLPLLGNNFPLHLNTAYTRNIRRGANPYLLILALEANLVYHFQFAWPYLSSVPWTANNLHGQCRKSVIKNANAAKILFFR